MFLRVLCVGLRNTNVRVFLGRATSNMRTRKGNPSAVILLAVPLTVQAVLSLMCRGFPEDLTLHTGEKTIHNALVDSWLTFLDGLRELRANYGLGWLRNLISVLVGEMLHPIDSSQFLILNTSVVTVRTPKTASQSVVDFDWSVAPSD